MTPVRKFRSVEDMPPPPWYEPGDPTLLQALAVVLTTARGVVPHRVFPPGVYRHRTIESLNRQREEWSQAYVDRLIEARRPRA
jgi:hypothetical protein